MGMNFIGFHTYPESRFNGHWKAEPLTWIGLKDQINGDGTVKAAYPAMHSNTRDQTWGYFSRKTSDFSFGSSQLFEEDYYGADYMMGVSDWPHTDDENIKIFDDVGKMLGNAFTFAHKLAVKTCLGTETPLTMLPAASFRQPSPPPTLIRPPMRQSARHTRASSPASRKPIRWTISGFGHRRFGPGARNSAMTLSSSSATC